MKIEYVAVVRDKGVKGNSQFVMTLPVVVANCYGIKAGEYYEVSLKKIDKREFKKKSLMWVRKFGKG